LRFAKQLAAGDVRLDNISAYLYTIADSAFVDWYRAEWCQSMHLRAKYDLVIDNADLPQDYKRMVTDKNQSVDWEGDQMAIVDCLVSKMIPSYQKIYWLRFHEGWKYEEIAKALQLPLGTVKGQLFRIKELCQKIVHDNPQIRNYSPRFDMKFNRIRYKKEITRILEKAS
jgi:RNA polymerase sigma-70 factor (ECF subfamily)